MMTPESVGRESSKCVRVRPLQADMMPLRNKGRRQSLGLVPFERLPRAGRPMVYMLDLSSQTLLEQLPVLAEVVQQPGQVRLVGRAEGRCVLGRAFGHRPQVVGNRVLSALVFAGAVRQILAVQKTPP